MKKIRSIAIALSILLLCAVLASCADPSGKVPDDDLSRPSNGAAGDDGTSGKTANETESNENFTYAESEPQPTNGIYGYWVKTGDALYFGEDGICRFYETFTDDIYEEYWEYTWELTDENTVTMYYEGESASGIYVIEGNRLIFDGMTFTYHSESAPEICYYDTCFAGAYGRYLVCEEERLYINMSYMDIGVKQFNEDFDALTDISGVAVLTMENADDNFASVTLADGVTYRFELTEDGALLKGGEMEYKLLAVEYGGFYSVYESISWDGEKNNTATSGADTTPNVEGWTEAY